MKFLNKINRVKNYNHIGLASITKTQRKTEFSFEPQEAILVVDLIKKLLIRFEILLY